MIKTRDCLFALVLTSIYSAAWFIQDQLYLHWDISHLMHSARLMLKGGHYLNAFFSPNPPLIMFLYLPAMALTKLLPVKLIIAFRLYIFGLITLSLGLCHSLVKPLLKENKLESRLFISLLAFSWLIIPLDQLGQRDCLMFILGMPYLLLMARRLKQDNIALKMAIFIGLLAGLGFGLKPQFLLTPFLLELYYLYRQRQALAWCRPEIFSLVAVLLVYGMILLSFYQDFLFVIIPYLMSSYYQLVGVPTSKLVSNFLIEFSCLPLVLFISKPDLKDGLTTVLFISLVSFVSIIFMQHSDSLYHLLPALSLALMFSAFLLYRWFSQPHFGLKDYLLLGCMEALYLGFFYQHLPKIRLLSPTYEAGIYLFLTFMFSLCFLWFSSKAEASWKKTFRLMLALILSYALSRSIAHSLWDHYYFAVNGFFFILLLGALVLADDAKKLRAMFALNLSILIFALPAYFIWSNYRIDLYYKETALERLVEFMRPYPGHSITVFSASGRYAAPLINYSSTTLVGRFDCLWMIMGLMNAEQLKVQVLQPQQDQDYFVKMIVEDLHNTQPDFVFVSTKERTLLTSLDFLAFFKRNKQFRKEWQDYQYFATVQEYGQYELQVYKRKEFKINPA